MENLGDVYKHKDGGLYEVAFEEDIGIGENIILYREQGKERIFVRTESHFIESFTKQEVDWKNKPYISGFEPEA